MKRILLIATLAFSTTHAAQQASIYSLQALFPQTEQEVHARVQEAEVIARTGLAEILAIPKEEQTFDNMVRAYDQLRLAFRNATSPLGLLKKVAPEAVMRDACEQALLNLSSFSIDLFLRPDIYHAFTSYMENGQRKQALTVEERHYEEDLMESFKSAGFALPEKKFSRVKELKKELSGLSMAFSSNIANEKATVAVTRTQLDGVRDGFINSLRTDGDDIYLLGADYPTYGEVMGHCTVASTRKSLYRLFQNRAYPSNIGVLERVIERRDELSHLLGYESYAHMNLNGEMVATPERAQEFIAELQAKALPHVKSDFEKLTKELPEGVEFDADGKLNPWDVPYVATCYTKKHKKIDARVVAQYFPTEHTIDELFKIYQQFFSLDFEYSRPGTFWHKDVVLIDVREAGESKVLGHIFLDLHPREGKYTHACHVGLVPGLLNSDSPSVGCVIANFPASSKDEPSLLKHGDVKTFFHEFGHALHHVLGRTELSGYAGTSTATDFVEMPSQMFEQWLFDRDVLKGITKHYKTGEPMPDEMLDKLLEGGSSAGYVRGQCSLALFSLACYEPGEKKDTVALWHEIKGGNAPYIAFDPQDHFPAAFGHLMGYGAGYYGYLWSKVIAHDCFEKVLEGGLLNPEMGREFRDKILSKGGSVDPNILVESFLGREVRQDAFLADLGLA